MSSIVFGIFMVESDHSISLSETAITFPFLALISWIEDRFFSKRKSCGQNITLGIFSSMSANGPCFNSPEG
jgi:hypothetical protein